MGDEPGLENVESPEPRCRFCAAPLTRTFLDLGEMPSANAFLDPDHLDRPEPTYPLHARVCDGCLLVQVDAVTTPEHLFSDYAYFSSYSDAWLEHSRRFAEMATERFGLGRSSMVVEVASNDGYLLKNFMAAGIPCLGIEPALNVAEVALAAGVPTEASFFGTRLAESLRSRGMTADLLVANNVLAHVPDLNDFVQGLQLTLNPNGVLSVEFPHLLELIEKTEFDTIYHEHFCYFSILALRQIFEHHGLRIFDVEQLPTHGGSLRVLACRQDAGYAEEPGVERVLRLEREAGLDQPATYDNFAPRVEAVRSGLTAFLRQAREDASVVVGYGAAAKGNTLLNFCGVSTDDLVCVLDRNPHKQGRLLPGSHIPVRPPDAIKGIRPDYVLILAWNWADEITDQLAFAREWGCQFVVPIPATRVLA